MFDSEADISETDDSAIQNLNKLHFFYKNNFRNIEAQNRQKEQTIRKIPASELPGSDKKRVYVYLHFDLQLFWREN